MARAFGRGAVHPRILRSVCIARIEFSRVACHPRMLNIRGVKGGTLRYAMIGVH